jgi:hypothetical protein
MDTQACAINLNSLDSKLYDRLKSDKLDIKMKLLPLVGNH